MKARFLILTLFGLSVRAQTPTVLTASISAVSDTFQNYAMQNPTFPPVLVFGDADENEIANQLYIPRGSNPPVVIAAVSAPSSSMFNQTINGTLPVTVNRSYVGLGTGFNGTWIVQGVLPPDTTMGISTNQILQWVNIKLTVLNKNDGSVALGGSGFVNANQIWSGLGSGSVCATQNQGDPIVQYDRLSGHWVLMQFAFTIGTATQSPFRTYPAPPYAFCWAVSQTSDATGAYNLYQFNLPNLPDYPKLGVWPDAYYLTDNGFTFSTATGLSSYVGSRVCAFNRSAMIGGGAAGALCFSGLSAAHFSMLPGDFEGSILPPTGEAAFILSNDWFTKNAPPYGLQLRRFHPDFVTPANSTLNDGFGGAFDSFVSLPFDNAVVGSCGDVGQACVPQPGTPRVLDTLSLRAMYRLAYRNLDANREILVFTESVGPAGSSAGIQLIEIRNPAANPPVIYNNVNFNPDSTNRWLGSAATDKLGNVALGYSVSSSTLFPGIRIAGRLRNDIRNSVRGEINVQSGSGSQTSTSQRWGDYSTMQIDPSDDCTFWYTTQYIINTAPADWATRIVGLKFNSCQ
jgi:hypothetical protein